MNLKEHLNEERGSSSFDYKFWFWAKKGSQLGFGYARQDVQLDIEVKGKSLLSKETDFEKDMHPSVKKALNQFNKKNEEVEDEDDVEMEVVEKKIKANTKRIQGIADLFSSPIIIHWLTSDKPDIVTIPRYKDGDVTDLNGKQIKVLDIFRDPEIREFVTHHIDWTKVNINDEKTGDTLNTIISKFVKLIFDGQDKKNTRKIARDIGISSIMSNLKFENKGIEVVSFSSIDYKFLPKQLIGSRKIISKLSEIKQKNADKLMQRARDAFKK